MQMKSVIVLGSTGSVGKSTLSVARRFRDRIRIAALSAHKNESGLLKQAEEFEVPRLALSGKVPSDSRIRYTGEEGLRKLIQETDADLIVNGISGSSGLLPSITAVQNGRSVALANKETIVMAGPLLLDQAQKCGVSILPVDSEHAALFQLLRRFPKDDVSEMILTASGGAFRDIPLEELGHMKVEDALQHPVWDMGAKITIDAATMANKGLEIIEASHLFGFSAERIRVSLHPESMVHSMIRGRDGSFYAQISEPDMRVPIQAALSHPDTWEEAFASFDYADAVLSFRSWDPERYPMLKTAYEVLRLGGAYPLTYSAANEIAVQAFMDRRIGFLDIHAVVASTLERDWGYLLQSYDQVFEADNRARTYALDEVSRVENIL